MARCAARITPPLRARPARCETACAARPTRPPRSGGTSPARPSPLLVSGGGRGADLCDVVLLRDDLLAFEMAAFLRKFLILDVNPGNAAALEFAHRAKDIELVAVAGIGIGDDGQLDGGGNASGIGHHLGHRDE